MYPFYQRFVVRAKDCKDVVLGLNPLYRIFLNKNFILQDKMHR